MLLVSWEKLPSQFCLQLTLLLIPVQATQLDIASTEKIVRLVHNVQKVRKGSSCKFSVDRPG